MFSLPPGQTGVWELPTIVAGSAIINQVVGLLIVASNLVMYPVEASFRQHFISSAKRIVRDHPNLQVVAVTGSFGKTSTKEIIAHILSSHHHVLKTPRSFNTMMGICKVIREDLRPDHDVFVVEMGAYKKGEIKRLCELTPPHIGVLTAVGPQHLERFKTLERVAEAKYELMEHLPPSGKGIFNGDDPICRGLSERPASFTASRYGLDQTDNSLNVWARNVTITEQGTEFDLCTDAGASSHVVTSLLGQHNVSNILAGVTVALAFGLTLPEIARAITTLEPIEHRLQRIQGAGGVTVIDDAYNANPAGVRMALDVLERLPGGRKVLITPGMVELGDREEEEHLRMGALAAEVCDYVILVGIERTRALATGLRERGFPTDHLATVKNLDEATRHLQTVVKPGDVVLFENDLPDTYTLDTIHF
jgi:UDP-N-acetylmuramoyl-tripeptide--D-alanyl-D-alanine ligase